MPQPKHKGYCYLLHIHPPYQHAGHYLGWAQDLGPRLNAHFSGCGGRLPQVALDAGCSLTLVRVWEDADRTLERQLKRRKNAPSELCPVCRGHLTIDQARNQFNYFKDP